MNDDDSSSSTLGTETGVGALDHDKEKILLNITKGEIRGDLFFGWGRRISFVRQPPDFEVEGGLVDSQEKKHKQTVASGPGAFYMGATEAICMMRVDMSRHCPITGTVNEGKRRE